MQCSCCRFILIAMPAEGTDITERLWTETGANPSISDMQNAKSRMNSLLLLTINSSNGRSPVKVSAPLT